MLRKIGLKLRLLCLKLLWGRCDRCGKFVGNKAECQRCSEVLQCGKCDAPEKTIDTTHLDKELDRKAYMFYKVLPALRSGRTDHRPGGSACAPPPHPTVGGPPPLRSGLPPTLRVALCL